ncbi:AGC family protein kinase [Trichomonas vaginalis G3]|uniref:AGC family protein kinase n=1 Tax=Trichomonas vaginalis (strain ATCC PRA-98 / G3) TaxID=412133 RepID=A2EWI0_TRIV3|nr:protein serine/threonine kinase protein [Trichomonas vaginalis G3]EAY03007.1 AGC family protein kinase [Trichomonas vaginalis G3]KAI5501782.1 protein serine/threonine kinase protein [Trichomonas vaginalis G3]|eukprot:XP_001315230.1 AGC family protein kinase [Trichomonas vaginalis G3]
MEESSDHDDMTGEFYKKGSKYGFWHKRFCVLRIQDMKLLVYIDKEKTKLDRAITITSDTECILDDDHKHPSFTISGNNIKSIRLSTDDLGIVNSWVTTIRTITMQTPQLSMNDFKVISVIGRGFYGKVTLCELKKTHDVYAIKSVHKSRLLKEHKSSTVITERNILMHIDHPFIVHIYFAFQTSSKVYMGFEYIPGGDLAFHLNNTSKFTFNDIKLFIAELALAIDYIHQRKIVYRDLKPENILIDEEGHLKLTDFGLVKNIAYSNGTKSFCGTPEYIAPEVIRGEKYGTKIDWWALGILAFNLLYGKTPWNDENQDKLFNMILNDKIIFPDNAKPNEIDLITHLLNKDPSQRKDMKYLVHHPFFEGLDFNSVLEMKYQHDFRPIIINLNVATNFDREFLDEPIIDSLGTPVQQEMNAFDGFSFVADPKEDITKYNYQYELPSASVKSSTIEE